MNGSASGAGEPRTVSRHGVHEDTEVSPKKPKRRRIPRHVVDLLRSLVENLELLCEYHRRAFEDGDPRLLGEVAGKIRVLAVRKGMNRPLLIDLMGRFGSTIKVTSSWPPDKEPRPLADFMEETCLIIKTPSGEKAHFTNLEFVATWSQQHGAAHQDWEHDEGYVAARTSGVVVGGLDAHVRVLRGISRTVLLIGDAFLQELSRGGVIPARPSMVEDL